MDDQDEASFGRIIGGRYALYGPIASGGMATVHFGRQLGAAGFARTVAIKRLRGEYLESHEFISTLLDEARLASRIRHPNVVATMDMVAADDELFLVMEYVVGESLSRLLGRLHKRKERVRPIIATAILSGVLHALHAAHEATDERGEPLGIVHRDVSPQNILIGVDGMPRLLDFGIAKGKGRIQTTRAGQLKGKVSYMAPEQILGEDPDRRSDIYAAAVVLWEVLTGVRLFPTSENADNNFDLIPKILEAEIDPPSEVAHVPRVLDGIVMRGLNREPDARYATAREFAVALEDMVGVATNRQIGDWVHSIAAADLEARAAHVLSLEALPTGAGPRAVERIADATVKRRRRNRLASQNNEMDETQPEWVPHAIEDPPTEVEHEPVTAPRGAYKIADPPTEADDDEPIADPEELKATRVGMARAAARARQNALAHARKNQVKKTRPERGDAAVVDKERVVEEESHDEEESHVEEESHDEEALKRTMHWTRDDPEPEASPGVDDGEVTTGVYAAAKVLRGPPKLPPDEDDVPTRVHAVEDVVPDGPDSEDPDSEDPESEHPESEDPDSEDPGAPKPTTASVDVGDDDDDDSTLSMKAPRPSDFRPSVGGSLAPEDDFVVPVQSRRWMVILLVLAAVIAAIAAIVKLVGSP